MSLISGTNFVAPLRSKVQIVGIFALAALIAVLRLAGSGHTATAGGNASESRGSYGQATPKTTIGADEVDSYLASRRRFKPRSDAPSAGDVTVEKLLQGEDSGPRERSTAPESEDASHQPEKLNDIKRSLGLE